jgi:hypothetical protein
MEWKDAGVEVKGMDLERNPRVVKVNIPEDWNGHRSGNGEGMWAFIRHEEDQPKYDKGEGEFELILLNTSIYWPQLKWGTVILAESRGGNRPVIAAAQFTQLVAEREEYFRAHPEARHE